MTFPSFSVGETLRSADMNAVGLWLIERQDVTAQQNVDFTSKFSDEYSGYKLFWDYTQNTTRADLNFQFRNAAGVMNGNHYTFGWGGSYSNSGTPTFAGFSYQTSPTDKAFCGSGAEPANSTSGFMEIQNPQGSNPVYCQGQAGSINFTPTLTFVYVTGGLAHNTSGTRTGCRLSATAGTMTGRFALYGYKN